jgi:hypothetical protein
LNVLDVFEIEAALEFKSQEMWANDLQTILEHHFGICAEP